MFLRNPLKNTETSVIRCQSLTLRIGLNFLTVAILGFYYVWHMNFFLLTATMIKLTDSLLSKFVLLGLSICMCIYLFLDKKLIRIWHQDQQWRQYFRTFIYSFGYVGKENNFPLPFWVLSWNPCNKRQINQNKTHRRLINMQTSMYTWEMPREKWVTPLVA